MPMAVPTMPDSASGVSKTRCSPKRPASPSVIAEHPAERADVLAEDDDAVVGGQAVGEGLVERGRHGHR